MVSKAAENLMNQAQLALDLDESRVFRDLEGQNYQDSHRQLFAELRRLAEQLKRYAGAIPESQLTNDIRVALASALDPLSSLAGPSVLAGEYLRVVEGKHRDFAQSMPKFLQMWPVIVCGGVVTEGLLDGGESQRAAMNDMKTQMQETLVEATQTLRKSAADEIKKIDELLTQTTVKAAEIEKAARRTAEGISLKKAQDQFDEACKHHWNNAIGWGALSVSALVAFVWAFFWLVGMSLDSAGAVAQDGESATVWVGMVYTAVFRFALLSVIGLVTAFCLRLLRAHLHMAELSRHRKAITNSIEAFQSISGDPQLQAQIVGKMVEAVTSFGNSGILHHDADLGNPAKISIDAVTGILGRGGGSS